MEKGTTGVERRHWRRRTESGTNIAPVISFVSHRIPELPESAVACNVRARDAGVVWLIRNLNRHWIMLDVKFYQVGIKFRGTFLT